jgi:hypothetical protein
MTIEDIATLADQLANLYPTVEDSTFIVRTAGFETVTIEFSNRPRDNWWNILQEAAYKSGALRKLLEIVVKDRPENQLIPVILNEIVATEIKIPQKPEEGESKRERVFRGFKQYRKIKSKRDGKKGSFIDEQALDLEWFHQIMDLSKGVGIIKSNGGSSSAILLNDGYVLTFYWPVTADNFEDYHLQLQHELDNGRTAQLKTVNLDPSFIHSNESMHYTLLRRAEDDPHFHLTIPVGKWNGAPGEEINLISHLMGLEKRISGGTITGEETNALLYLTDSSPGSAGGPVIQHNTVIAMHLGRKQDQMEADKQLKYGIKIESVLLDAGLSVDRFTN